MNIISKWVVTILCSGMLNGCGSSKEKAEELIKVLDPYKTIVVITTQSYITANPDLPSDQIKRIVEKNISEKLVTDTLVDVYADHFDSSELEILTEATRNPQNAMAIVARSKGGMALAKKAAQVQSELQGDIANALKGVDEDIVNDLDSLRKNARG